MMIANTAQSNLMEDAYIKPVQVMIDAMVKAVQRRHGVRIQSKCCDERSKESRNIMQKGEMRVRKKC